MSLSKNQYPASSTANKYVHQSVYNTWYASLSTLYAEDRYKYEYEINTTNGAISKAKVPANINGGYLGFYNPNSVLKTLFDTDFNPEIAEWTTCPNSIKNYFVKVREYSPDIVSPDVETFSKAIVINSCKEDFDYEDYMLVNGTESFLTDWTSTREVSLTDCGSLRCLSGQLKVGDSTKVSRVYELAIVRTTSVGHIYYYKWTTTNPYYGSTQTLNGDNSILEDLQNWMLDIPCCPGNFANMKWKQTGYQLTGGTWQSSSIYSAGCPVEVGDTYTVRTYTWPYGDNGRTSNAQTFKVVDKCSGLEPIQLQWQNDLTSFDFFSFDLVNSKSLTISKSTYRKFRDSVTGGLMGHTVYDRGESVYHSNIETTYIANTNWLTNEQVDDLELLWESHNVFAYMNSTWYPVISNVDKQLVGTSKKGLRQYLISFRLSNKKYK